MSEVVGYLKKIVDRAGLYREKYADERAPDSFQSLAVVPAFPDIRSEFILSSLILNQYKKKYNPYLIVVSWPKHSGLYDYADEFWSVKDEGVLNDLTRGANGFSNEKAAVYEKTLLRFFDKVLLPSDEALSKYYKNGITKGYIKDFDGIEYHLPLIPSVSLDQLAGIRKPTVFIYPTKYIRTWRNGRQELIYLQDEFWSDLMKALIQNNYYPVVYQDYMTHDISQEFSGKSFVFANTDILSVLGAMRLSSCAIDFFNGFSRYALVARCPYLACDERQRFVNYKEYEIDDLCGTSIPRQYMFSFAPSTRGEWEMLVERIVNRLNKFVPNIDRNNLPSTIEQNVSLDYKRVRDYKIKRFSTRFFSVPKLDS